MKTRKKGGEAVKIKIELTDDGQEEIVDITDSTEAEKRKENEEGTNPEQ